MLRESGFRADLRRTVDAIPLPPGERWVPKGGPRHNASLVLACLAVAASVLLVAVVAAAIPEGHRSAAPAEVRATPPARPTFIDGRYIAPVPQIHRNTEFGYNVLAPSWFRRVTTPVTEGEARGGLMHREVLTARPDANTAAVPSAWDLSIEVWKQRERGVRELAEALGCATPCNLIPTTLEHGSAAQIAAVTGSARGKIYLIDRGETILVLRYLLGTETERPADVTEETLERIARAIGLV